MRTPRFRPDRTRRPLLSLAILATVGAPGARAQSASELARRHAILVAEDRRDTSTRALAPVREALTSGDTVLQVLAVRALGRFERPGFAREVAPLLGSGAASVRAEAANALAQAAQGIGPEAGADAQRPLDEPILARLAVEKDPWVRGVMLRSLGRMPNRSGGEVARVERLLATSLGTGTGAAADAREVSGAVRGLEALLRTHARTHVPARETVTALRAAARTRRTVRRGEPVAASPSRGALRIAPDALPEPAEIRRLALAALIPVGRVGAELARALRDDPDVQVRRLLMLAAGADTLLAGRRELLRAGTGDRSPMVRYEALRPYGRAWSGEDCAPLLAHLSDQGPHVALLAIDLLGGPCADRRATDSLVAIARTLPASDRAGTGARLSWHRPAHALPSLARRDPARAAPLVARFRSHPVWQVRMYAAHAADAMRDADALNALAHDTIPNVREAAVAGLAKHRQREASDVFVRALSSRDYQLVLTAANALAGASDRAAVASAVATALARITEERRETSRDPRLALLARVGELGDRSLAPRLRPLLVDFDAVVADSAAAILARWTGTTQRATPRPIARSPLTAEEVARLRDARLRITMAGGGTVTLRLLTDEAPATVVRVARLARAGAYDGRTFHRVVPNFVLQGGSPGANEYVGHDPYMRDEVWLRSHARGTLGISTRGRDTGDAQLFVNLVDNPRLDFGYTVFAVVEEGMEVLDRVLEGEVMRRVELVPPAPRR